MSAWWQVWSTPLAAWLIRDRKVAVGFLLAGGVLGLAAVFGIPLGTCPLRAATGILCPGCGMTRAVVHLSAGRWDEALASHAFAPLFAAGAAVLAVAVALPAGTRERCATAVEAVERRTGVTAAVLVAVAIYGLTRNFAFP